MLCWYDENSAWLGGTVTSLKGFCDGVIAVDGPYASFPGALRVPRSDPTNAEAIQHAAWAADLDCLIYTPREPWWSGDTPDEEVAKRDFMCRLGDVIGSPGDWYFVIDADESLHAFPFDARETLEKSETDLAEVEIWVRPNERFLSLRLYRGPGMRIAQHHYQWVKTGKNVGWPRRGPDAEPGLIMSDVVIEHRVQHRSDHRKMQKQIYYDLRDKMLEARGIMPMMIGDGIRPGPDVGNVVVTHGGAPVTEIGD